MNFLESVYSAAQIPANEWTWLLTPFFDPAVSLLTNHVKMKVMLFEYVLRMKINFWTGEI